MFKNIFVNHLNDKVSRIAQIVCAEVELIQFSHPLRETDNDWPGDIVTI